MPVRLQWIDVNSGSIQEDGFKVWRNTSVFTSGTLPAVPLATLPAGTEQYDDATVIPGTLYYYMVETYSASDGSQFSALVSGSEAAAASSYSFTISILSVNVGSTLTDFVSWVDLSAMPVHFWDSVQSDGGNVRVYESDGVTLIPHDLTFIDSVRQLGRVYFKKTLSSSIDTDIKIKTISGPVSKLAVGDANGRNAVWSDYEVVFIFPEEFNRTGNSYVQDLSKLEPQTKWLRIDYHVFSGSPHQGVATDSSGRVISLDTNYFRRYDEANLASQLAFNSDPISSIGIAGITHLGDGCIIGSELFIPAEASFTAPFTNQRITVFNADTLAYLRSYDISANAHEISGIAYDGTDLWITDYQDDLTIRKYSTVGVLLSTIVLDSAITNMQGVEVVNGKLYISSEQVNNPVYEVEFDGTVNGVIYNRPTTGTNEGISFDGTDLWILNSSGAVNRLNDISSKADWRKIHYDDINVIIDPFSTVFTFGTSIYWTATDLQQGFLSMSQGTANSDRASLAYHGTTNKISWWNSTDSWADGSTTPLSYQTFRIGASHDGTASRKTWFDGTLEVNDSPISARPISAGTSAEFIVNATETNAENGEAYYQYVWLRHEIMTDDWMSADSLNSNTPASFYTIAEDP